MTFVLAIYLRNGEYLTSIGERWSVTIIKTIKDANKPIIKKDLYAISSNSQTLRDRLCRMEEEGLIDMTVYLKGHKKIIIELTPLGNEVAVMLSMVDASVSPHKRTEDKSIDMKYAETVLRIIRRNGTVRMKDIMKIIPSFNSLKTLLAALCEDGLLLCTENEKRTRKTYSLTDLGKNVADVYQTIWEKIDEVRIRG